MTQAAVPYFREAGNGPGVVCLHSNASSSSQWRELMEALAPTHRVLAPDGWSAGRALLSMTGNDESRATVSG